MSNQDSTTIVDLVASAATPPPVRKKRRRKTEAKSTSRNEKSLEQTDCVSSVSTTPATEALSLSVVMLMFQQWIHTVISTGYIATGYGVSLLIHAIVILVMSFVVLTQLETEDAIQTTMSETEETSVFDEIVDVRMDMPEGDVAFEKSLESAANMEMADWADNSITTGVEESIESLFETDGSKGLGGSGFLAPKDARVFKKGSFSVWTIPNDPDPGEDYVIVIVIKLPNRVKRYRASDLSGMVVGTDGYRKQIPGPAYTRGKVYLPMKDKMVQLKIGVPGGEARVKDVITIRSVMLREKQVIKLEF